MKTLRTILVAAVAAGGLSVGRFSFATTAPGDGRASDRVAMRSERGEISRNQGSETGLNIPFLRPRSKATIDENRAEDRNREDALSGRMQPAPSSRAGKN